MRVQIIPIFIAKCRYNIAVAGSFSQKVCQLQLLHFSNFAPNIQLDRLVCEKGDFDFSPFSFVQLPLKNSHSSLFKLYRLVINSICIVFVYRLITFANRVKIYANFFFSLKGNLLKRKSLTTVFSFIGLRFKI